MTAPMTAPAVQVASAEFPQQRPSSTLRWLVTDITTGTPLEYLNECVQVTTPLRHTIGQYDSANVTLWLSDAPAQWDRLVSPLTTVWHAYREDNPSAILWSGTVALNPAEAGSGKVDLGLSTIEYYLDRRRIDYDWNRDKVATGQNEIVEQLIQQFVNTSSRDTSKIHVNVDGTLLTSGNYTYPGVPIQVVKLPGADPQHSWAYYMWGQGSVYQRMQELSAIQDGPEWTIEWAWGDDGTLIPTLYVGARLGASPVDGLGPAATFRLPGNLITAKYTVDYSDGKGANSVWATSSGQGDSTPTSDRYVTADMRNRPTVTLATQPSTSIKNGSVLNGHAQRTLDELKHGTDSLTLSASMASPSTPVYGQGLHLGDDVYYKLGGRNADGVEMVPEMPGGKKGTARVLAVEIDSEGATLTPIVRLNGVAEPVDTGSGIVIDGTGGDPRFIFGRLPGGLIDGKH